MEVEKKGERDIDIKEDIAKQSKEFRDEKINQIPADEMESYLIQKFNEINEGQEAIGIGLTFDRIKEILRESHDLIQDALIEYLDHDKDLQFLNAIWVIGTYFHHEFESYPYLFFNAMKGSGKSRIMKLICTLSKDGQVMASPTEAVLFRSTGCLGIDEFEGVANKDKSAIRELLNAGYKRGTKVFRTKKVKKLGEEGYELESFEPYRPIVMCNIWGMDNVLGDRCITQTLEKSDHKLKTRLIENYERNENVKKAKELLKRCSLCSVVMEKKHITTLWNDYLKERETTYYTYTTTTTPNTYNTLEMEERIEFDSFFNKIYDSDIIGRNLELFFPIFYLAWLMGNDYLIKTIKIAKNITESQKGEEQAENVDILVYKFVSEFNSSLEFHQVKDLTGLFRSKMDLTDDWINHRWFGRALKRLNLVTQKRRLSQGIEIILNVTKAQEKFKIFERKVENEVS